MRSPEWNKNRARNKQQHRRHPRARLRYLQSCHPHTLPPMVSQAAQKQADAHLAPGCFFPFTCWACSLLLAGTGLQEPARLTMTAGLAADHPRPAPCLQALLTVPLLNASPQQAGKRDLHTQGSRRWRHVFPARGPKGKAGLPTTPTRLPTSLFSYIVLTTHILKTMACAAQSPLCSSQHLYDVCNWKISLGTYQGLDPFLAAPLSKRIR